MTQYCFETHIGFLTLKEDRGFLVAIDWGWTPKTSITPLLRSAEYQINAYFCGRQKSFDLPLSPTGTKFQQRVWSKLQAIPYGTTTSYGGLARYINSSARAIGNACGQNPIPIVIPCHRVIKTDGSQGGYSGPENTKKYLLNLECDT